MRKQDNNLNHKIRNNNKRPFGSMASSALLAARLFCNQSLLFPSRKQPSIEAKSRRKVLIISSQKNKSKTNHKIEEEEPIISSITSNVNDYFLPLSPPSLSTTAAAAAATTPIQKMISSSIMKRPRRRRRAAAAAAFRSSERTRFQRETTSISKAVNNNLLFLTVLIVSIAIISSIQLANCSMCQHHQAMIEAAAAAAAAAASSSSSTNSPSASAHLPVAVQSQNLIICPKSSQHNNLPQFPPRYVSPTLERQQREILNQLNISFANHLQLNGSPSSLEVAKQTLPTSSAEPTAPTSEYLPNELIDDELLNEIISPLVVDAAYERAKELIVKRRKLENELVKNGFITDMSKPTAVARHQRVTTTTTRGNELEKTQEVFEEMSRILAKNLSNTINMRFAKPSEAAARQLGQVSQLGNGRTQILANTDSNSGDDSSKALSIGLGESASENVADFLSSGSDLLETADSSQILSRIDLHSSEARHAVSRCEEDQMIVCDPNFPYRHADGRCNNLQHPSWGKANTCFARLLAPDYSDGQSAPRISVTGHPLPNPRILSAIVHRDFNYPATYTHFVMQYGQFFAHDIAFTPSSRTKSGQMIQCCPIERDSHPQCFPILVPPDDPFYSNWEESCLNFVRTAVCPRCRLGPREQMNQITSFVDGSQVYGSAANETAALWTKNGPAGRMHVSLDDAGRELLPHSADPSNDQCSDIEKRQFCYRAGDRRVNQHPALTSVHVMWLRQHNRVVNALKMINPHWNGDRLYQEAKRICTSQMQMVTYNEWLSLIIGQEAMKFLKLNVMPTGYTKYDPTVDPSLLNEFSGAAFRFGHSMINNIFAEILPDGRPSGYRLNEFFFHPFGMKSGQHDMVMRGLISQASQNRDPFVSSDIKNHLYRPRDNPYGLDLPAFNIQRGRDHGIPGYTKLVEFCFDDVITNWKQLDQYMPVSQRIRFSKLYRSVHDLDLFSAGLAEYPLPGAALGPTFTCIVGIQMFNLKYGDRFWFEHGGQVGSFTPDQLQEIRKTNLARLMCANSDNMNIIQKNVFRGESPSNPSVPCSSLPDTDLKAWMEAPGTKSAFSQTSSMMEDDSSGGAEVGGKRKRRQRPKQEPLAYAFRGSKGSGNHKKKQTTPLGNDYAIMQRRPTPNVQQQQQQQQPPQLHGNQNNSPQYSRPNQTPMNNGGGGGGGGGGGSQHNHGSGQQTNYMQTQNTNNRQVPFGMPVIRISLPKQAIQQSQQIYKQASSPAVTFDNTLLNIPPR